MKKSEQLWKCGTDGVDIADENLDIYSSKCCNSGYANKDIKHSVAIVDMLLDIYTTVLQQYCNNAGNKIYCFLFAFVKESVRS